MDDHRLNSGHQGDLHYEKNIVFLCDDCLSFLDNRRFCRTEGRALGNHLPGGNEGHAAIHAAHDVSSVHHERQSRPQNKDKNFECKIISQKVSGGTVSYQVECTGKEGVVQTSGTTTYTDKAMNGASTTSFKMKGQPAMTMSNKIRGKYIGPCPKAQ